MYGVTSMYFSAVMVCPDICIYLDLIIIWKDIVRQSICLPLWFLHILSLQLKKIMTKLILFCIQVRLMLVLAPVMCILSGIGVSQVLTTYMKNLDVSRLDKKSKKQQDSTYPIKNEVRTWGGQVKPGYLGLLHVKLVNMNTLKSWPGHWSLLPSSFLHPGLGNVLFLSVSSFYPLDEQSFVGRGRLATGISELILRWLGIDWLSTGVRPAAQPIRNRDNKLYFIGWGYCYH